MYKPLPYVLPLPQPSATLPPLSLAAPAPLPPPSLSFRAPTTPLPPLYLSHPHAAVAAASPLLLWSPDAATFPSPSLVDVVDAIPYQAFLLPPGSSLLWEVLLLGHLLRLGSAISLEEASLGDSTTVLWRSRAENLLCLPRAFPAPSSSMPLAFATVCLLPFFPFLFLTS